MEHWAKIGQLKVYVLARPGWGKIELLNLYLQPIKAFLENSFFRKAWISGTKKC